MVAVALSMALTQLTEAPLLIVDEIDASLDSAATRRVALLIRDRNGCKIVVSHRPEMYETADRIVGLFRINLTARRFVAMEHGTPTDADGMDEE